MSLIRWLHISDIHTKGSNNTLYKYNLEFVLKALLDDIKNRHKIDPSLEVIDFCFISGDIAYSGKTDEYYHAYEHVIEPISLITGINKENFFLIPGNHDNDLETIDENIKKIQKRLNSNDRISEIFVDNMLREDKNKLFLRQQNYKEFIEKKFQHLNIDENCEYLSHITLRNGVSLKIVGVNSAWLARGGKNDLKKLSISEPLFTHLFQTDDNYDYLISIVHHPIKQNTDWYLNSEKSILNKICDKSDFIISGHVHEPDIINQVTAKGSCIELTGGSIYENREWDSNTYNYVVFETDSNEGVLFQRKFSKKSACFKPDIDVSETNDGRAFLKLYKLTEIKPGSSINLFDKIFNLQYRTLINRPLFSDLTEASGSVDFLFPDVYIDPFIKLQKHPTSNPLKLSEWFKDNFTINKKILILGQPGSGKTTSLIYLFNYIKETFKIQNRLLPIFIEARDYKWNKKFSFSEAIEVIGTKYNIAETTLNSVKENEKNIYFLFDAFDEALQNFDFEDSRGAKEKLILQFPHIATSRIDFFLRKLSDEEFYTNYDEIIIIEPWLLEREVNMFLTNYLNKYYGNENNYSRVQQVKSLFTSNIPYVPLTVITFLFLWLHDNETLLKEPIKSFAILLDKFLIAWAKREVKRNTHGFKDKFSLLKAYEIAAWEMYLNRDKKIQFKTLANNISKYSRINTAEIIADRGFRSMFLISINIINNEEIVNSFIHESIYEFILAKKLANTFCDKKSGGKILTKILGHSINKFARELLEIKSEDEKIRIVTSLRSMYYKSYQNFKILKLLSANNYINYYIANRMYYGIIKRHNICYFWGRLESQTKISKISELFKDLVNQKVKDHDLIICTAGSSILLRDLPELEKVYLYNISNNSSLDICNRMYHLVYYGDANYTDLSTFLNDPLIQWIKTKSAILGRIKLNDHKSQKFRSLDIVTFRRFCETRKSFDVNDEEYQVLWNSNKNIYLSDKREVILQDEYNQLVSQLNRV